MASVNQFIIVSAGSEDVQSVLRVGTKGGATMSSMVPPDPVGIKPYKTGDLREKVCR